MKNLVSSLAMAIVLTAGGVGLVKSFIDGYYASKPHITYLVNGKEVITRTFDSNEEMRAYQQSDRGKQEAEFYLRQNRIRK